MVKINSITDEADDGQSYVYRCEDLLQKLSSIFHPNHFLIMRLKSQLISQYGNVHGYSLNQLPADKVLRKLELCREFIEVFSKVEPGEATDWWAATSYEAVQVYL